MGSPIFRGPDARGGKSYEQAHTHTRGTTTVPTILIKLIMKALKCKPSAQFAYNYTINISSKCGNIISHRSSVFATPSIFEGRHIDPRSSKVDKSIFEGRHIDHRSSKVDTSIFEDRRWKHRTDNPTSRRHFANSSPNIVHQGAP